MLDTGVVTRAGKRVRIGVQSDAAAIAALEAAPQQSHFVIPWTADVHRRALGSPDYRYFIADGPPDNAGTVTPRGFAVLGGLQNPHRVLEVVRVIVDGKRFGLGADLLDTIVRYAFLECRAHRVWTDTFEDNTAARRLARHYGFIEEGLLRDALVFDGQYRSVIFMGLLEAEAKIIIGTPRKIGAIT